MSKIKDPFTLKIDGHWWFMSRMNVLHKDGVKSFDGKDFEDHRRMLLSSMTRDLVSEINRLAGIIDSVVITNDKHAWRKKHVYLKRDDEGTEIEGEELYKAHREADASVNWENAIKVYNEWQDVLNHKFNIAKLLAEGAEGDDLIAFGSRKLNALGKNVLFMSADKDLIQCNRIDAKTGAVSIYYLKTKKGGKATGGLKHYNSLMITPEIKALLEAVDESPFDIFNGATNILKGDVGDKLLKFSELTQTDNLGSFLTYKTLLGDPGDGVFELICKSAGKTTKHTQPKWIAEAIESVGMTHDTLKTSMLYDEIYSKHMISFCYEKLHKVKISETELEWLQQRWNENRHLVMLNDVEVPDWVLHNMEECSKDMFEKVQKCDISFTMDEVLSHFSIISNDNALSMHENIIYQPSTPQIVSGETFDVDDIVNQAIQK